MSIFAFRCENGKRMGKCPFLVRTARGSINPLQSSMMKPRQIRVLHVDDDAMIRRFSKKIFGKICAEVVTADGHESALEVLFKNQNFDAIVLDFDMGGGKTGAQLFWKLPEECRKRVLFFSGESVPEKLAEIKRTGRPLFDKATGGSELLEEIKRMTAASP